MPRRRAGYVEQFDTLLAELSVREMLMYTAELKRPVQACFCLLRLIPREDSYGSSPSMTPAGRYGALVGGVSANCACLLLLQEPMAEKRAQVEHLLEVLGLQVTPRLPVFTHRQANLCYAVLTPADHRPGCMLLAHAGLRRHTHRRRTVTGHQRRAG